VEDLKNTNNRKIKKYYGTYGGILVGGLYGLLMRIVTFSKQQKKK